MARRGRPKKNAFEDLPDEFKARVDMASSEDVRKVVSEVAIAQQELMDAKEMDMDYQEKKEAFSAAGEVYREGTKMNKLKIKYCRMILDSRGQ